MRLSIFLLFLGFFVATAAGHVYTIDGYLNYAVTRSMASRGTLEVPRFMMTVEGAGGRHYSKLGVGQSLAGVPLYWIGALVERVAPENPAFRAYSREVTIPGAAGPVIATPQTLVRVSDEDGARVFFTTLTNTFISAGLCLVFWMLLGHFGLSPRKALWGTALLAFATPVWVYSRDLFAEPLFALCLVGTFWLLREPEAPGIERRAMLAGLLSSVGILARVNYIPIVGIFKVYLLVSSAGDRRWRPAVRYGLWCLPGVAAVGLINFHKFGSILMTGYHTAFDKGFSVPLAQGLAWNLASPYRSIFLYAPPVILFGLGFMGFARRYRRHLWLITAIVAYVFVVYSKWWAWHGGWCWGPRLLVPIIPLLLIPGLVAASRGPGWQLALAVGLGIWGFIVQLGAILINYTAAYDYWIKIGRLDWAEADIQRLSPISVHLKALLVTSPANYDLWIIQACRAVGGHCIWAVLGTVVILVSLVWGRLGWRRVWL